VTLDGKIVDANASIWTQPAYLAADDPLAMQSVNLRCFYNKDRQYELGRYLNGYLALHAHSNTRVVFTAIVGVPVDLVDQTALADVDFANDAQRDAFYQRILDDPKMQETVDPDAPPGDERLLTSCESQFGAAYPPRRIVELARQFGRDGLVQSICGDNFGAPLETVVQHVIKGPD